MILLGVLLIFVAYCVMVGFLVVREERRRRAKEQVKVLIMMQYAAYDAIASLRLLTEPLEALRVSFTNVGNALGKAYFKCMTDLSISFTETDLR